MKGSKMAAATVNWGVTEPHQKAWKMARGFRERWSNGGVCGALSTSETIMKSTPYKKSLFGK